VVGTQTPVTEGKRGDRKILEEFPCDEGVLEYMSGNKVQNMHSGHHIIGGRM
jgi:hypothetical protein